MVASQCPVVIEAIFYVSEYKTNTHIFYVQQNIIYNNKSWSNNQYNSEQIFKKSEH